MKNKKFGTLYLLCFWSFMLATSLLWASWALCLGMFLAGYLIILYSYKKQPGKTLEDFYNDMINMAISFPYLRPWAFYSALFGTPEELSEQMSMNYNEMAYMKRAIFKHFRIWIAMKYLSIWIVSPLSPMWGTFLWLFSKSPTNYIASPGSLPTGADLPTEKWFFVNGIGIDYEIAKLNATQLAHLFNRTIELIYKPTYGLLYDLAGTIGGRTFDVENNTDLVVQSALQNALANESIKRVVVVAHSQGSVVVCNAVRKMIEKGDEEVRKRIERKLEIFNFANMADSFTVLEHGPIYENFVNYGDTVVKTLLTRPKVDTISSTERTRNKGARVQTYYHKNTEKVGHFLGTYLQDLSNYVATDESHPRILKYLQKKKENL